MHFKHPEILYFLFLLVVPIIVHLFQLRRFKKEYFTNVRFLKALTIQTRKSSKIKKWLLLATRLLILTCLIIAFAQPFFEAKDHKNSTNEMYLVLDNSFSMQAKGQNGPLLKRAIQELLENIPENQTFSLITNSETFWNTDVKSIQKELQNLKYSASPFQLEGAMAKINSRKTVFIKDVVIISDAKDITAKSLKSIDTLATTYFVVPKSEQKNNVAIDSVFINQNLNDFYEIGVNLSVYGENNEALPIALYENQKLVAKTIYKNTKAKNTVFFTIEKKDFQGYVSINDNSLAYDNTYYFSITNPKKKAILTIGAAEKSTFLSRIYTNDEFTFTATELTNLDYNSIEKQDVIIVNELAEIPQALQTTLKAFVEKGGNLIFIPSAENTLFNANAFLSNFGTIKLGSLQQTSKLITKIAFQHPLFRSVFEKRVNNFQYPNAKTSFLLDGRTSPILSFEDQSVFLTSIKKSVASVYVFSAPINKNNSNFQNAPLIVPVFYNMAQNAQKTGIVALTIGDNTPFLVDASITKDEIITVKNTQEQFIPLQQMLNRRVKLTFNDYPEQAGNFGLYKSNQIIKDVSFNYNRTEGDLSETNDAVLSDFKVVDRIETVFDTLQTDRTDNEIWKWFVILTLLFLVTEIFIQKFVK
jgi:hypothetical protein